MDYNLYAYEQIIVVCQVFDKMAQWQNWVKNTVQKKIVYIDDKTQGFKCPYDIFKNQDRDVMEVGYNFMNFEIRI